MVEATILTEVAAPLSFIARIFPETKLFLIHLVEMICWLLGKHFNYILNRYHHGDDFGDVYNSEETSVMITF